MIKKLFILFSFGSSIGWAQDYHYAQFDVNPLFVNPALSGERIDGEKSTMFILNSRGQIGNYTQKTDAYKSVSACGDYIINQKFTVNGIAANNNSAFGRFNTFSFLVGSAYNIINTPNFKMAHQNLSIGLQLGLQSKSMRSNPFTYDQQYSTEAPDGFDKSIPSGESFSKVTTTKLNANFGIYYRISSRTNKIATFSGLAFYNITRSNESYLGNYYGNPLRIVVHAGAVFVVSPFVKVSPVAMYMKQASGHESNYGIILTNTLAKADNALIMGLSYRNENAIVFQFGVKTKSITTRLSYDVLTNYAKNFGNKGLELSLIYNLVPAKQDESTIIKPNL